MRGAKVFRSFFYEPLQGSRFLLQAEPALKCNFGSKLVEVRRGTPALCRPQVFPSYDLPIPWQALTFGEIFIYCNKKDKSGLGDVLPGKPGVGAKLFFKV